MLSAEEKDLVAFALSQIEDAVKLSVAVKANRAIEQSLLVLVNDENCGLLDSVQQLHRQVNDFNPKASSLFFQLVQQHVVDCGQVDLVH